MLFHFPESSEGRLATTMLELADCTYDGRDGDGDEEERVDDLSVVRSS